MACLHGLVHSEWYFFVRVLARKMSKFQPDVMIWWTLKMVLLENSEYSVRITGLVSFLLRYCIVMQAIWCSKF